ncbi:ShKT domain-containing protein [Strongyloides ratti]|uniref:ShKT domain-containing protein n=1 Tax=Strongyloides ratti TaxID=34506 RepID=A0A090LKI5_STRRB|nr:ShKT domain-containing protein [Strongyloides ratti]CEF70327.1 ShKT domain-containing protein [Strongyloides ratti]
MVCVNLYPNCQNFGGFCNMPIFSNVMMNNCPATCGVCVTINGKKQTDSDKLIVSTDKAVNPIGPCLNGLCPENHVCIDGNCYRLKVTSSSGNTISSTSQGICIDVVQACPRLANVCTPNVQRYCPASCNVCIIGKK